jgi:hypothetical protein
MADDKLAINGIFPIRGWDDIPLGGRRYKGEKGACTEITMYGLQGFKAFLLPANGRLEFGEFGIYSLKEVKGIEVLEVDSLKVNGRLPIEKWLPYKVICDLRVTVSPDEYWTEWESLNHTPGREGIRKDYPKEKVEMVQAQEIRHWRLEFRDVRKPNRDADTR